MKVSIVQTHLHWENREKNLAHFDSILNSVSDTSDLIVLPEMFTTGFTMKPEVLAESDDSTLRWMQQKAREKGAALCGSVAVKEGPAYYNRLYWVEKDGSHQHYNKRHLFRMAKEDEHYSAGKKKIITRHGDWKICPLVCYDLRFPVWCRNRFIRTAETSYEAEYDVLLFVANWPEIRSQAWKQLLVSRAIENQCYVIGVNRIGADGNDYAHSGDSMVINPRGEVISSIQANEDAVETLELDKSYLLEYRKAFPVGLDADDFELKL